MKKKVECLKSKLDLLLWFLIALLPFFAYFVANFRSASPADFLTFVNANYAFAFIQNTLDSVCNTAFGNTFAINGLLSYMVGAEILHILFDFLVFIPRFAHDFMERVYEVNT